MANKGVLFRSAVLACSLCLSSCSTWFFPYVPETAGTWTGKINRITISRKKPDYRSVPALEMTITDGPPIKTHKNGAWSHADTLDSKGVNVVLVDRKDRTILNENLIGQSVWVRGVISLTEHPSDSVTGEAMDGPWIIKTDVDQIHLIPSDSGHTRDRIWAP